MQKLIKEAKRYAAILDRVIETSPAIFDDCARGIGTSTTNGLYHAIRQAEKDTVTAAAPELLEALEQLANVTSGALDPVFTPSDEFTQAHGDARAAIAKAKGETE